MHHYFVVIVPRKSAMMLRGFSETGVPAAMDCVSSFLTATSVSVTRVFHSGGCLCAEFVLKASRTAAVERLVEDLLVQTEDYVLQSLRSFAPLAGDSLFHRNFFLSEF